MLEGEKILITGATGKIAFPIARALARNNDVWGAARLHNAGDHEKLASIGVEPLALDLSTGDFPSLPDDFSYVFHAAVDPGQDSWRQCVRTNAHYSGDLLYHYRSAKGFVFCSTGSIYGYQGQRAPPNPTRPEFRCAPNTASRRSRPNPCAPGLQRTSGFR